MSDEVKTECGLCGREPGPMKGCSTCQGNQQYLATRQYSLSDHRAMRVPQEDRLHDVNPRYGDPRQFPGAE